MLRINEENMSFYSELKKVTPSTLRRANDPHFISIRSTIGNEPRRGIVLGTVHVEVIKRGPSWLYADVCEVKSFLESPNPLSYSLLFMFWAAPISIVFGKTRDTDKRKPSLNDKTKSSARDKTPVPKRIEIRKTHHRHPYTHSQPVYTRHKMLEFCTSWKIHGNPKHLFSSPGEKRQLRQIIA